MKQSIVGSAYGRALHRALFTYKTTECRGYMDNNTALYSRQLWVPEFNPGTPRYADRICPSFLQSHCTNLRTVTQIRVRLNIQALWDVTLCSLVNHIRKNATFLVHPWWGNLKYCRLRLPSSHILPSSVLAYQRAVCQLWPVVSYRCR